MGAVVTTPFAIALTIISTKSLDLEYWYKWIVSYVYIEFCRRLSKKRFDLYDMYVEHDPYRVGFLPPPEEIAMESPLPESQLDTTADEVFFYGTNSKSECLTVRVARGPDNESEAFVRLRLEDGRTYELREAKGFQQSCCDKRVFSCGDLHIHHLSPMRRWRIFFNGLMRETCDGFQASEKMVHVKFALLWRASSDVFDFTTDVNTKSLATAFAKAKWNQSLPPLEKLQNAMNTYTQSGVILGNVTIEGLEEDYNLYLFGEKIRFMGDVTISRGMESFHILGWTSFDGRFVHVIETSIANIIDKLRFGYIVQPTGGIEIISDSAISLEIPDKEQMNSLKTKFHADGDSYELNGNLFGKQAHFQSERAAITIDHMNLQLNSLKGSGIILKEVIKVSKRVLSKKPVAPFLSVIPTVVQFSDVICQNSEITGGKGSSLGKLTELSKELKNFTVPEGIVITTAAYEKFLSKEVIQEIKNLENSVYSNKNGDDIKVASQKVVDKVVESTMPEKIHREIVFHIEKVFPGRSDTLKFAVRSSATGEDTEQMSAAGQMDTYLGVVGIDEIMSAVKKCWASQFGHCAVQYKRQNGQILNSPMAVVIQEMVSCDVAGVLFTCDPLTGDPTQISITANYGLGESVVSGSEEPDTVELKRNKYDKLIIKNKIIGSKSRRIVIKENGEGTSLEEVPEHERLSCCLSDDNAIRLGDLATKLQTSYRSHRDLEWGYWKNHLYIFQSRPVTSGSGETDFEIDHEMDVPLRVENDYYTVSNAAEVMPGAMTPLGSEVLLKYLYICFQRPNGYVDFQDDKRTKYFPIGMASMYNHTMFSCPHLFRKIDNKSTIEANSIAVFGRIIEDEEMYELTKARYGCIKKTRIVKIKENVWKLVNTLFMAPRRLKKCQKTYENFHIPVDNYKTAQEMFNAMMYSCSDLVESFGTHMWCSEASAIWNIIIFSILRAARGEVNSDVYTDFSKLLTSCSEVESADVPSALEEISESISKVIKPEDFKKMEADEAVSWLQSSTSDAGLKYREFLHKHGHRCLREFDVHSKTWLTDPSSLIQQLQNTVGSQKKERTENERVDNKTLISNLKTPLNSTMRFLMNNILVPMSRKSVQDRECSKSVTIRGLNEWRKGYAKLAKLMASEGRIPDEDLLYFMTVEDIKELLDTRSPRIIARANHRRRRYPTLDKYILPEISKGVPVPINLDNQPFIPSDDCLSMTGIPVSQGIAKGFVRVAITLEEASLLQSGEILVTYSTDIGWSPYFPILSGVVTELGGLISHGAVVSREYGLPCIAGLHGATRQFQTGDYALLDGNKGILHKLPPPENL